MRVLIAITVALFATALSPVQAQTWPNKPITLVVPFPPGGGTDAFARPLSVFLAKQLGRPVVIDNRGGAGGIIGVELAARSSADGYTLLVGAPSSMILSRFTYGKLAFDTTKDFDPVSMVVNAESVMVVHPGVPVKSVKEFIALARAKPRTLNMGSAGIGASSHLAGIMFVNLSGIDTIHVPYKGGGPMATAVVAGESQWAISPAAALTGHIKAGRMRALAISSASRSPLMPDLPTIAEAGVPGYEVNSWSGVIAPAGLPRPILDKLNAAVNATLEAPEVKARLLQLGNEGGGGTPEQFGELIRRDSAKWAEVIRRSGARID